ncbi:MAG: ABC transporter substrate-binding protein [Phascolarctobacterium faecium]
MQRGTADDVKISGTGPYIVQSLTPTEIVLTKNPAYWGGRVKTDKVIVRSIPDGDTLTMALQNGEIDATQGTYASLPLFTGNAKFKVASANTSRVFQACLNFTTPVLQEPAVRKAIAMAIDKDKFTSVLLNGNGTPAVGPFLPICPAAAMPCIRTLITPNRQKLLREAGWTDTGSGSCTLIKTVRTLPSAGSPILPGRNCLCWPKRPRLF